MSLRRDEFARRLAEMTGAAEDDAYAEVDASIERWFFYAGWADKYDGAVHHTLARHLTMAVP
jgi:NAD-dependent aldehyde dehydrogenases